MIYQKRRVIGGVCLFLALYSVSILSREAANPIWNIVLSLSCVGIAHCFIPPKN